VAQVIRYVDPDAAGAGTGVDWTNAYTSLQAWDDAEVSNLVTDGDYHTVYCRSSSGTQDTTPANIGTGWMTDATHYIEIIGYDGTYIIHNNDVTTSGIIDINFVGTGYIRLINLKVYVTTSGTNQRYGIYNTCTQNPAQLIIDSCTIKGFCSGTGSAIGVYNYNQGGGSNTCIIYNSIVQDFISGSDNGFYAVRFRSNGTAYNCTVYNSYYGISGATGTNAINCAVANNTADFAGFVTADYCCSNAGDGTNAQTPSGGSWANEFTTPGTDFSLLAGGNCVGKGTDNPGSGLYADDIRGKLRTSTWDIGAYEQGSLVVTAPKFHHYNKNAGGA